LKSRTPPIELGKLHCAGVGDITPKRGNKAGRSEMGVGWSELSLCSPGPQLTHSVAPFSPENLQQEVHGMQLICSAFHWASYGIFLCADFSGECHTAFPALLWRVCSFIRPISTHLSPNNDQQKWLEFAAGFFLWTTGKWRWKRWYLASSWSVWSVSCVMPEPNSWCKRFQEEWRAHYGFLLFINAKIVINKNKIAFTHRDSGWRCERDNATGYQRGQPVEIIAYGSLVFFWYAFDIPQQPCYGHTLK